MDENCLWCNEDTPHLHSKEEIEELEKLTAKKHYHVPCNMPDCNIMFESLDQMKEHFIREHVDDPVNHPKHYASHPSGIECIEVTRHYNFNVGNAMKYLWRQGLKDSEPQVQDLQKAAWYIQDEIKRLERENLEGLT